MLGSRFQHVFHVLKGICSLPLCRQVWVYPFPFTVLTSSWKGTLHSASSSEGVSIAGPHQENREVKPMEGSTPKARLRNGGGHLAGYQI